MADTKLLFAGIGLLIGGIMSLATSAIGTQCYNDHEDYSKSKGSNYSFLVFNLITAILTVLSAGTAIYYSFKKGKEIAASVEDIVTTTAESSSA